MWTDTFTIFGPCEGLRFANLTNVDLSNYKLHRNLLFQMQKNILLELGLFSGDKFVFHSSEIVFRCMLFKELGIRTMYLFIFSYGIGAFAWLSRLFHLLDSGQH